MAGMLQLRRLGGLVDTTLHAFRDEIEAIAYLRETTDAARPDSRGGDGGVRG